MWPAGFTCSTPISGCSAPRRWVVGRDRGGTVLRWSLPELDLLDRLDPAATCDPGMLIEDEEPTPVNNRGIGIWHDKVYVTLGYHDQMAVIDLPSFKIDEIRPNISGEAAMEWICTEHPDMHIVSDKKGRLFFGSLDTLDFTLGAKLDEGTIHRVRYDRRHDRFGFTHQLWDCVGMPGGDLIILTQDGLVRRFDPEHETVRARAPFRRQAVWDIQPSLDDADRLYCATDDGVAVVEDDYTSAAGPLLRKVAYHVTGLGFTRRVVALPGGWIGVTRDQRAFRSDEAGNMLWTREFDQLVHTAAVSPEHQHVLIATNGGAVELSAATGETVAELDIDGLPIWVVAYTPA